MSANVAGELRKYRSLTVTLIAGFTVSIIAFVALLSVDVDETQSDVAMQSRLTALAAKDRLDHVALSIETLMALAAHSSASSSSELAERIRTSAEQLNLARVTSQYCLWIDGSDQPFARQIAGKPCPAEPNRRNGLTAVMPLSQFANSTMFVDNRQTDDVQLIFSSEIEGGIRVRLEMNFAHLISPPASFPAASNEWQADVCLFWQSADKAEIVGCNREPAYQNSNPDAELMLASAIVGEDLRFEAARTEWQMVTVLSASAATVALSMYPFAALLFFLVATAAVCFYVFKTTDANLKLSREQQRVQLVVRELEKRNDDLEQFAYMASHDLQTPVRHIISRSSMLVDDIADEDYATANRHAGIISDAAERMQAFILDLLAFCRAGNDQITPGRVDVTLLVDRHMEMIRDAEPTLGLCVDMNNLPIVHTDEVKLSQVFQNLLTNSVKFAQPGKPLTIEVNARWDDHEKYWEFSVADNGIGIDPEQFDRIFLPFKVLDVQQRGSGTGIGLSITKRVITALGGKIWVESEPGVGTTFYFTLPYVYNGTLVEAAPTASARSPE